MLLYYSPGACSQASHIVLNELNFTFEKEAVDLKAHKTAGGKDFYQINPKGSVPALILDNGELLTEGAVIMQYLSDHSMDKTKLFPAEGHLSRYRCQEWLNYIGMDVHKSFGALFGVQRMVGPAAVDELKNYYHDLIAKKCDFLTENLKGKSFLLGDQFTIADCYLFVVLGWSKMLSIPLEKWPTLIGYVEKVKQRPMVQKTLKDEGLLK